MNLPAHLDLIAAAPDGIRKLRGLILELAVRGKLVAQDPNDEPAGELLKRIARERGRLEAEGTCKKSKAMPLVGEDEQPFALPLSWTWTRLGEITNFGQTDKDGEIRDSTWVLDLEDIQKDTSVLLRKVRFAERQAKSDKNRFQDSDVLYGKLRPYLNKVIVADEDCYGLLDGACYVRGWSNGMIQQQAYKLIADKYCCSEFIIFIDSDCLFKRSFTPADLMRDGKPILLKTRYESLPDAVMWKRPTEKHVGFSLEWEYMRRFPLVFRSDTLSGIRDAYPEMQAQLRKLKNGRFSEFNVMGAFAERYQSDKYFIIDTEEWSPPEFIRQFYSWGGLTDDVLSEIGGILNA